jgi:hypothetical protein
MATQLNELVVQTLHTLRTKSFRELETLPSVTNETVKVGKKTVHVQSGWIASRRILFA